MSKKHSYSFTGYGDHVSVERLMKNKALLAELHNTSCTKKEAIGILKDLSRNYFGDEDFLVIKWDDKKQYTYGGYDIKNNQRVFFVELGTISQKKARSLKLKVFGLRIGIVLHEFAHVLDVYNRGDSSHGRIFVKTFTQVINYYKTKTKSE